MHSKFESEFQVRPDDLDMNAHVHNSRYFDYVLAARYDQMARCYGMPMEEFIRRGFGWVVQEAHIFYKRALGLGEKFIVQTWIDEVLNDGVKVKFEIRRKLNNKVCSDGTFHYTMVDLTSGRATQIPQDIVAKYSV